jgi:transposase
MSVFGMIERDGRVYTEVVPDHSKATPLAVIRGHRARGGDPLRGVAGGYDGLVNVGREKHFPAHHGDGQFIRGKLHINGIENSCLPVIIFG